MPGRAKRGTHAGFQFSKFAIRNPTFAIRLRQVLDGNLYLRQSGIAA